MTHIGHHAATNNVLRINEFARACERTALDLDWTPGFAANRGR
jgi:hypothetical protein